MLTQEDFDEMDRVHNRNMAALAISHPFKEFDNKFENVVGFRARAEDTEDGGAIVILFTNGATLEIYPECDQIDYCPSSADGDHGVASLSLMCDLGAHVHEGPFRIVTNEEIVLMRE